MTGKNVTQPARYTRIKTRYPGITYRVKAGGVRTYAVLSDGIQHPVDGGQAEALKLQASFRSKPKSAVAKSRARFGEVGEQWHASKKKRAYSTRKSYRDTLDNEIYPIFEDIPIGSITTPHIISFIEDLEERDLAPNTIKRYCVPLSQTLGYAASLGLIPFNPYNNLTRDQKPGANSQKDVHFWNDEEIAALNAASVTVAARPISNYDYSPLIASSLATGMRLGESLGLQRPDLDLEGLTIYVKQQWTRFGAMTPPKSKAGYRVIPITEPLAAILQNNRDRLLDRGIDSLHVFPSLTGGPMSHRNVTARGFEPAAELAGIEGVTFHSMRHAFASRMIFNEMERDDLRRVMGHESDQALDIYTNLFNKVKTDARIRAIMERAES